MKKLTLNKMNFAGATELTREQLKKVMGGDGYGTTEGTAPVTGECSPIECICPSPDGGFCVSNPSGMPCSNKCAE